MEHGRAEKNMASLRIGIRNGGNIGSGVYQRKCINPVRRTECP